MSITGFMCLSNSSGNVKIMLIFPDTIMCSVIFFSAHSRNDDLHFLVYYVILKIDCKNITNIPT